jgi:hypothetical protein
MDSQIASTEQVSQDHLQAILKLTHSGLTPEDISFAIKIEIETVNRIITLDLMHRERVVQPLNTFICSYTYDTGYQHRTN